MAYPPQFDPALLGSSALRVAEEKGWGAWTLRDVAAAVGVTANALYRHVEDRDGLVTLMGKAAACELLAALERRQRAPNRDDPDAAVVQLSVRFIRFATARPHAYAALIHGKPLPDHPSFQAWGELWQHINQTVRRSVPESVDAAAFALWAFLHGRVGLSAGAASQAPVDAGLEDAVRALMTGFRERSPVASPLPALLRRKYKG